MKRKLLNILLILGIFFFLAPFILYFILNSSLYNEYNLYYSKADYISFYYDLMFLLLFFSALFFIFKYIFMKVLKREPFVKAELLSIEKLNLSSQNTLSVPSTNNHDDIYNVKFKHKNEIILLTVTKDAIKKDLSTGEHPYVEYQYFDLMKIFNKFHNIKVHTKK